MINEMVEIHRQQRWQEEQERLGNEALNEVIEKAKGSLNKRRKRSSEIGSDEDSDAETEMSDESGDAESHATDDSNMSSSESESEEDQIMGDDDEGLTQEQLREKYATIPSTVTTPPPEVKSDGLEALLEDSRDPIANASTALLEPELSDPTTTNVENNVELEEVDATLLDDSDASTDMDDSDDSEDEFGDDENMEDAEDSSEQEEEPSNLLGFFGKEGLQQRRPGSQAPSHSEPNHDDLSEDEDEEVSLIPDETQGPDPSQAISEEAQDQHDEAKLAELKPLSAPDAAQGAAQDAARDSSSRYFSKSLKARGSRS